MDFKEHVASIVNVLIFAGLIKIRFTLRRKSTKVLLFPVDRKRRREKERDGEYVLLFTHFVSFFRFQVSSSGPPSHRRQSWARSTRRFRRLMRSLWHDRARKTLARYRRFSCIFRNCTINEKAEKSRRLSKILI